METDPQAFKRKYEKLLAIHKKYILYNRLGGITALFMVGSLLAAASDKIDTGLPLDIEIILFMAFPMGISIFFLNRSNKYIFTLKQRMFFKFYKTEIELETFLDIRTTQSKKNAKTSIDELALYVSGWISNSAPSSLNELPRNIRTNLREKMLPIIEEENMQGISSYRTTLYNFILRVNDKEPSIDDLTYFNNALKSMVVTTTVSSTLTIRYDILGIKRKTKEVFSRNPKLKYIPIGVISYAIIWIYVQNTQSPETIQIFVNNSTIAGVIIGIVSILFPSIWKQKSSSTTTTEVGEDNSI